MKTRYGIAALAAAALVLSSCAAGDAGQDGEKVELKFMAYSLEDVGAEGNAWQEFVDAFEAEHPDISVQLEQVPTLDMRKILPTRLASGTGPDVWVGDSGIGFAGPWAQQGLVMDLQGAYEERGWPIYDWAKPSLRYTGGDAIYEIPDEIHTLGMYYNKDMFSEMGLEVPTTIEELYTVGEAFAAEGIIPLAFGNKEQFEAGHLWSMVVSNNLQQSGLDNILAGDGTWTEQGNVDAIKTAFVDFVDRGLYIDSPNGLSYQDSAALFYSGKAAMFPTGSWIEKEASETSEFEVGYVAFPSTDGESSMPFGIGNGWFVSASTEQEEAALTFLDYVTSDAAVQLRFELLQTIPAQPLDISDADVSPLGQEIFGEIQRLAESENPAVGYNIDVVTPQNFIDQMFTGFSEVLSGSRTPEQQAEALEEQWQIAKEEGNTLASVTDE